ncbi:unnamed protein product, partial [Porites lobata]
MDQDKIQRMTSNKGVSWKWNQPAAPHFGGVFESMINSLGRLDLFATEESNLSLLKKSTRAHKTCFRNDNLRVGDVVVVIDPGNVGRIEQTYPCPDGALCEWWTYGLMARPLQ